MNCSNQEQMPLIIRFVDDHGQIQELFVCFVKCDQGTTGEQIAAHIKNTCQSLGLDFKLCRGQGYDGAGNMAGKSKGAAALIRLDYPKALYFHCASHKLNLCVANSCKLTCITNMSSVSALSTFFNYSPGRQACLEASVLNYPNLSKSKLIPLCRTRWVERLDALEVTIDLLEAVVDTFIDMTLNVNKRWNRDTVAQASALLKGIDFEFIMNLVVTQKVLAFTSSITTGLQKHGLGMVKLNL